VYFLYNLLLFAAFPVLLIKALIDSRYREGLAERLGIIPDGLIRSLEGKRPIWYHAASVGEVIASKKLIDEIKKRWPEKKILVSTFTATGNQTARKKLLADGVIFLPVDLPFIISRAMRRIDPSILIIMETELWPNLIGIAGRKNIPVVIVNGRISDRSIKGYRRIRALLRKIFENCSLILTQSEANSGRFIELGAAPGRVKSTGNLKFDFTARTEGLPFMKKWGGRVFIAGSTHSGEDGPILDCFIALKKKHPDLKLLLAPRHPNRSEEIEGLLAKRDLGYDKRSVAGNAVTKDILLLDTLGELAISYREAEVVFIGGSLVPVGGQNVLEPALYGKPVLFGPYMQNFREADEILIEAKGGIKVSNKDELEGVLDRLLSDPSLCEETGRRAREAVAKNQGATKRTLEVLADLLKY